MHFNTTSTFLGFVALRGSAFVRSGNASFWSPREPLKTRNFGTVDKCCCGNCRSNIFQRFQNVAFLRPSWGPPFKGLFSSCFFYSFKIYRFWGPPGELFCAVRQVVFLVTPGAPQKKGNFEIVEKCCCGSCRSNTFRRFQNFAFLRPS